MNYLVFNLETTSHLNNTFQIQKFFPQRQSDISRNIEKVSYHSHLRFLFMVHACSKSHIGVDVRLLLYPAVPAGDGRYILLKFSQKI